MICCFILLTDKIRDIIVTIIKKEFFFGNTLRMKGNMVYLGI